MIAFARSLVSYIGEHVLALTGRRNRAISVEYRVLAYVANAAP